MRILNMLPFFAMIWPGLFTSRDCNSGKAVAYAAVVNYRKWVTTQPMQ